MSARPSLEVSARSPRRRDADATRRALVEAAGSLFDEKGFEGATTREIGARAGADPALIARYFGTKEGLYLAVLEDPERAGTVALADQDLDTCLRLLLARWSQRGRSPVATALTASDLSPEVTAQLRRVLDLRVIAPLTAALRDAGADGDLRVEAELAVALIVGIAVGRTHAALPALAVLKDDDLVSRLLPLLAPGPTT